MSVSIPFKTLRDIDLALKSPNLVSIRASMAATTKLMQPMIDSAIEADRAEKSGIYDLKLGLTS